MPNEMLNYEDFLTAEDKQIFDLHCSAFLFSDVWHYIALLDNPRGFLFNSK